MTPLDFFLPAFFLAGLLCLCRQYFLLVLSGIEPIELM